MNPVAVLGIIITLFEETQRLAALAKELQEKLDKYEATAEEPKESVTDETSIAL